MKESQIGKSGDMGSGVDILVILKEDAEEHKRKSINNLASMIRQFFDDGIMKHTIEAMVDKPLPGEFEGNCHAIAVAFMTDLIIARQAQGCFWMRGGDPQRRIGHGKTWEHSWLEYNGFAVDATEKQKEKPDRKTISIGEIGYYYKARKIKKVFKRRDATNTLKWVFKHAKGKG